MTHQEGEYSELVEHIQQLEHQLNEAERQGRAVAHEAELYKNIAARRLLQLKTVQTLNLGVFARVEASQIYQLACQNVVQQVGWDVAFVVTMVGGHGTVLASYHATEKQLSHLQDHLHHNPVLIEAYAHRTAVITHQTVDTQALSLRSLFQVQEVVALPIVYGDRCFGYLVAGETSATNSHNREEIDFLAGIATLLAYAVQQNTSLVNLEEQNKKLRQLDELKDSFISITSHQLRTPLSIIKWILSILRNNQTLVSLPEPMKLIGQAYETNERLIHVVNDLLNVSRIQEGKLPYNPQPSNLAEFITELTDNARPIFESKQIKLELVLADNLPVMPLDPILFKEAVQNLMDNAMDYNLPENGWVKIEAEQDGDTVVVRVSNSGQPIPQEELAKIFEQFYRSPQAISIHPNGNGLGLYLARAIVHEHGGTLTCTSSTPENTAFTITLPVPK